MPNSRFLGAFRGEPGLENVQVRVGANYGVDSVNVADELARFEAKLQTLVAELDALLPIGQEPDADQLAAIVDLCAWVHARVGANPSICKRQRPHCAPLGQQPRNALWLAAFYPLAPETQRRLRGRRREGDAGRLETNGSCLSPIARRFSRRTLI